MVVRNVNLETVCGITSKIPDNQMGEVAFAGKSNVGKSSLINAILNRSSLARTSAQPGKTQTINFYNVNDAFYLVDLPGYGYARANEEIKAQWGTMIENYLHTSKQLRAVFLLLDVRREPSDNDALMYEWMVNQGFAPILILTKCDKLKDGQVRSQMRLIQEVLQVEPGTIVIPFSAETKVGKDEVWAAVEQLLFPDGLPQSCLPKAAKKAAGGSGNAAGNGNSAESGNAAGNGNIAGNGKASADQKSGAEEAEKGPLPAKKERWKKTGKAPAKKTVKMQEKRKHK